MSDIIKRQMQEEAAKRDPKNGPTLAELIASAGHDLDNSTVRGGGKDALTVAVQARATDPAKWGAKFQAEHKDMRKQTTARRVAIAAIILASAVLLIAIAVLASKRLI